MPVGIAVVGYGSAGKSRVRALAESSTFALRGVVSRRGAAAMSTVADAAAQLALLDGGAVLSDPRIAAVAICTESADHAPWVRAAIAAGKHVLVEYPLALAAGEGRALFTQAERAGVVLSEGHVELHADAHQELRAALMARPDAPSEVDMSFTGRADPRIAREASGGFASFSGFARLSRLVDLLGVLRVRSVAYRGEEAGVLLEASFESARGTRVSWREARGVDLVRRTDCVVRYGDGALLHGYGGRRPGPVFARDTEGFAQALKVGAVPRAERRRIEHCLDLAEELRARSGLKD